MPERLPSVKQKLKRRRTRNCKLPRGDGTVIVFESGHEKWFGGTALPVTDDELKGWVAWAAQTPKGRRMSGTRIKYGDEDENGDRVVIHESWGHPHRKKPWGATDSHMVKGTAATIRNILEAAGGRLDNQGGELFEDGRNAFYVPPDEYAAYIAVLEEQDQIVQRRNQPICDKDGMLL